MFDFSAPGRQEVGTGTASGFAPERQVAPEVALAYAAVTPKGAMPTKASPLVYDPRWNVWASAFGGGARVLGDNVIGSQTFNSNIFGGAAGADYRMTRDATVGFAVSGGQTNYALANSFGTGQTDFFQAGAYGKQRFGNAYVAAAVAGGEHQVKTDRFVTLGPAAVDHLTASFTASTIAGRLEGGYRYGIPTAGVTPYGAVQVQNVWTPAYTEAVAAGGGGAAQSVASRDVTTTRTELGAWFDTVLNTVTYRARAAWVHDFNRNASITETFATLPGASFVINGAQRPGDAALLSSMLEAPIGSNVALSARVDGEFATRATTWAGNVKLRYFW
jgi:uncharacterized protein with beta-barrel porin domain